MTEISRQDFENEFILRIFKQEFIEYLKNINLKIDEDFLALISEKEFTFKYKWRSKVELVDVSLKINGYLILLVPSDPKISTDPILTFNYMKLPTLEVLNKKHKSKLTLKNSNYSFGENDKELLEILDFTEMVYNYIKNKRNFLTDTQINFYKLKFEQSLNIKLSDISDIYFDFTAKKFFDYLTINNFVGIPNFDKFPSSSSKNNPWKSIYPLIGWELERKPDGYGHECGKAAKIDWLSKEIFIEGFSTDD